MVRDSSHGRGSQPPESAAGHPRPERRRTHSRISRSRSRCKASAAFRRDHVEPPRSPRAVSSRNAAWTSSTVACTRPSSRHQSQSPSSVSWAVGCWRRCPSTASAAGARVDGTGRFMWGRLLRTLGAEKGGGGVRNCQRFAVRSLGSGPSRMYSASRVRVLVLERRSGGNQADPGMLVTAHRSGFNTEVSQGTPGVQLIFWLLPARV